MLATANNDPEKFQLFVTLMMRKAEGVKQKVKIKLSAAAPAALLDYLLQNAGNTWLARCQDLTSCPRVAGPLGPSRIN